MSCQHITERAVAFDWENFSVPDKENDKSIFSAVKQTLCDLSNKAYKANRALESRKFEKIKPIKERCDWSICGKECTNRVYQYPPKSIFLSMKSPNSFPYFVSELLPTLNKPFVLVVGEGEAIFLKEEIEKQKAGLASHTFLDNPYLRACCVENLRVEGKKLFPLPSGILTQKSFSYSTFNFSEKVMKILHLKDKQESFSNTKKELLNSYKSLIEERFALSQKDMKKAFKKHAFFLLTDGEQDLHFKAWEALSNGCIPIIQNSPMNEVYEGMPVVVVDNWIKETLSLKKLANRFYTSRSNKTKQKLLERLDPVYWWKKILLKLEDPESLYWWI